MKKAPAANFIQTNQHQRKNDCIFCAMANALPVTYEEAREILARAACCVKKEIQTVRNIRKALCEMGLRFTKLQTRVQFAKFAADHAESDSNYIIVACDHAAAVVNGKLLDEWDSSRKFVQFVFEATKETYNQIKAEYRKEEPTMKNITLNQIAQFANIEIIDATPTTVEAPTETAAAIVPEVLPPETATVIPAPLQEQPNNLPGALLDLDERTLQLLKMQANLAAALPGVKSLQLVGRWLWLEFTGKPTAEIRQQLKDNRWSWAPKKGKWTYHNPEEPRPGKHRYMSFEEIESKHGSAAII